MKGWANAGALLGIFAGAAALLALWVLFVRRHYRVRGEPPALLKATCLDGWELGVHYRAAARRRFSEPVLLCHGLAANHFNFDFEPPFSLAHALAARGFDCFSIDCRGTAASRCSPKRCCSATYTVDDHIRRVQPDVVVHGVRRRAATLRGAARRSRSPAVDREAVESSRCQRMGKRERRFEVEIEVIGGEAMAQQHRLAESAACRSAVVDAKLPAVQAGCLEQRRWFAPDPVVPPNEKYPEGQQSRRAGENSQQGSGVGPALHSDPRAQQKLVMVSFRSRRKSDEATQADVRPSQPVHAELDLLRFLRDHAVRGRGLSIPALPGRARHFLRHLLRWIRWPRRPTDQNTDAIWNRVGQPCRRHLLRGSAGDARVQVGARSTRLHRIVYRFCVRLVRRPPTCS